MNPLHLDPQALLAQVPEPGVRTFCDESASESAFLVLGETSFGGVYFGHWRGTTPWERHPKGDELVSVTHGEVTVELMSLTRQQVTVKAGQSMVVPAGVWHRQRSEAGVAAIYHTPTPSDFWWHDAPPS